VYEVKKRKSGQGPINKLVEPLIIIIIIIITTTYKTEQRACIEERREHTKL
jgi:hypothetical protein